MRIDKRFRLLVLGIAVVSIFTLSIVFAVVSQTLTISTDVEVMPAGLNVSFIGDETESTAYNGAEIISEGTIDGTSISGLSIKLVPGSLVETIFTAVNNSENANVKLSHVVSDWDNLDIKIVHYIDEQNTREISLSPLFLSESDEESVSYILENLTEEEITDFGLDLLLRDLTNEQLTEEEMAYLENSFDNIRSVVGYSMPLVTITDENDVYNIYKYDWHYPQEDFFYSNNTNILYNQNEDGAHEESYRMWIYLDSSNIITQLPEGYSLKFTNYSFNFTYEQVE